LPIGHIVHPEQDQADEPERLTVCPNTKSPNRGFKSVSSGRIVPMSCKSNACAFCGPRKAGSIARAIALAEPERAIRLSLVPSEWAPARRAVNRLLEYVREAGYSIEMAWHLEPNPKGTGAHAHCWQHGDFIPQRQLQELSHRAGLGIPYIERVRSQTGRGAAVGYGLKGMGYGMKAADQAAYLDLNGGRLVHATRGFWRDGKGGSTLTLGAARRVVRNEGDPGPWHTVTI
jgi:hypothetical protein